MGLLTEPSNSAGLPSPGKQSSQATMDLGGFWRRKEQREACLLLGSLSRGRGNCIATKTQSFPKLSIRGETTAPEAQRKQRQREARCYVH